ncbi:MAG: PilZ domain-containing protein, partial [Oscillospiraceae bacterium]
DDYVELTFRNDTTLLLQPNRLIKVSIMNEKIGFKVIVGKVYVGSDKFIRLIEIVTLMDFEKRDYFRITIDTNSAIFEEELTASQAEFYSQTSPIVHIRNISLCGFYFESKNQYEIGQKIYILLNLEKGRSVFSSEIKRISDTQTEFTGYGCQFTNLNNKLSDQLYKYIYTKQLEYLKKHQSSNI